MRWLDLHLTLRKALGFLVAFLLACGMLLGMLQPLNGWNWKLVDLLLSQQAPTWPEQMVLVDLPWDPDPAKLPETRRRIADTLRLLAGDGSAERRPPRLVVLDLALSTLPIALDQLRQATDHLQGARVRMVIAANTDVFLPSVDYYDSLDQQGSTAIYDAKAAFGHTKIDERDGTFWYRRCILPAQSIQKNAQGRPLWALPVLVQDVLGPNNLGDDCPPNQEQVPFRPGHVNDAQAHTWQVRIDSMSLQAPKGQPAWGFDDKIVVIGNLGRDQVHGRSGPELVAWAIGAQISGPQSNSASFRLLNTRSWALGMAAAFSALCVYLSLQLNYRAAPLRNWPGLACLIGWLLALFALAVVVIFMRLALDVLFFQVGYVLCASGAAAIITRDLLIRSRRNTALYTQVTPPEKAAQGPVHDVFISYSHSPPEDATWVQETLYPALAAAKLDGRSLSVFLDKPSLEVGTHWFIELAEGIEQSRCVVAIYNRDYFHKGFCLFEIEKAMIRFVGVQGQGFALLPFCRDTVVIPVAFNHLQCVQVRDTAQIVQAVLARLQKMAPHPSACEDSYSQETDLKTVMSTY